MRIIKKLSRVLRHARLVEKLFVMTKDSNGHIFEYRIRIIPVHDRSKYLVKIKRTGPQGNPHVFHLRMTPERLHDFRQNSC